MNKIIYDTPIEIPNEKLYNKLMNDFSGIIAGRKDHETKKCYIKLWYMRYESLLSNALIMNKVKF